MFACRVLSACVLVSAIGSTSLAVDVVTYLDNKKPPVRGTVTSTTKDAVSIQERGEIIRVPVTELRAVIYENEPNELRDAREALRLEDNPARAADSLGRVDLGTIERAELKAEIQFFKLLARAKLAMGGKEKSQAVSGELARFLSTYPNTYHFYEATEAVGHLQRADQKYSEAIESFRKLSASPAHRPRAYLAAGWTQLDQNQPEAAQKAFDAALAAAGSGSGGDELKRMAMLGKAAGLGESGKTDEALKMVNDVIAKADPEERAVHARAYNVLGGIHLKAAAKDKDKHANEAVMAYLHVDVLYPHNTLEHAEAVGSLATLWGQVGHPQRANDARAKLRSQYPSSRWATP
jgi:hypothetical protein